MNPSDVDTSLFKRYVPLNALRPESQADLARKSAMLKLRAGEQVFRAGDRADQALYLIDGELQLESAGGKPLSMLRTGEPAAAHRIAHQSPRTVSARCTKDSSVLAVDAGLLDVMLTWDQTGSFVVGDVASDTASVGDDWMTRLLQMRSFQMVPPANLQAMFMRLQKFEAEPGQVIVKQGDAGDFFYVIVDGRCIVTREQPNQKAVRLAELDAGSCFGEEALIADERRNATVTTLTRTHLMRLAKDDFRRLLNEPLERRLPLAEAQKMVDTGRARWLDVRLPSEFQNQQLPGAINLPLYMLRMKLATLDQSTTWILYCDTMRRSSVGVFVLTQKGYDAYLLDQGLPQPH
ncbi:cyclic nucleotide-binding domain-containing protein [Solimonas terrae]|uniref:Cyclic nucleotide-binding domain-containing protein n=1 Tax=Solimonas terrae TaxID=1396819 RepID=A0A6M2BUQ6_9GAMM|nr:cyclic nucleotide-binding domain-containing protein [Solimonas terrae]NGY06326.1 cyclic nucleotide-binding domain-containing protein [Solimonas terrae]